MTKLYHASPNPITGNVLEPRSSRTINGKHGSYLFAADDKAFALTYTVTKGIRLFNATIDETGSQILIVDAEELIGDPTLKGVIYSFDSDNFEQAIFNGVPSNQWVSEDSFDLTKIPHQKIDSLNDLMRENIQIFQLSNSSNLTAETLSESILYQTCNSNFYNFLQEQLAQSILRWMNSERGINAKNPFPPSNSKNDLTFVERPFNNHLVVNPLNI